MNTFFLFILTVLEANGWVRGVAKENIKIKHDGTAIYIGDQNDGIAQDCHLTIIDGGGLGGHWTINGVNYPRLSSSTILGFQNKLCAKVIAPMEEGELGSIYYTSDVNKQRALTALNTIYWLPGARALGL